MKTLKRQWDIEIGEELGRVSLGRWTVKGPNGCGYDKCGVRKTP